MNTFANLKIRRKKAVEKRGEYLWRGVDGAAWRGVMWHGRGWGMWRSGLGCGIRSRAQLNPLPGWGVGGRAGGSTGMRVKKRDASPVNNWMLGVAISTTSVLLHIISSFHYHTILHTYILGIISKVWTSFPKHIILLKHYLHKYLPLLYSYYNTILHTKEWIQYLPTINVSCYIWKWYHNTLTCIRNK